MTTSYDDNNATPPHNLVNVPLPAGSVRVYEWDDVDTGAPSRYFVGDQWVVERDESDRDITIRVDGTQRSDGRASRQILVLDGNTEALIDPLTRTQARELARALIAAADEVEQMNAYDPLVTAT
jgi:hypothetical protein